MNGRGQEVACATPNPYLTFNRHENNGHTSRPLQEQWREERSRRQGDFQVRRYRYFFSFDIQWICPSMLHPCMHQVQRQWYQERKWDFEYRESYCMAELERQKPRYWRSWEHRLNWTKKRGKRRWLLDRLPKAMDERIGRENLCFSRSPDWFLTKGWALGWMISVLELKFLVPRGKRSLC